MAPTVKIPWGLSGQTGKLLHVDDVPNGKLSGCVCPACGDVLVARNKGHKKVHHFAHYKSSTSCEGWLHATAKHTLFERIESALEHKVKIEIRWKCSEHYEDCVCPSHTGNLLRHVDGVRLEKQIRESEKRIQPDITLTKAGAPWILVEIVDTSKPKERTFEYVEQSGTHLLIFYLADADDILTLKEGVLTPSQTPEPPCPCHPCPQYSRMKRCPGVRHVDCDICKQCFRDETEHGHPLHKHCRRCRDVNLGRYPTCYCCYNEEKHGLPPCGLKGESHRHCLGCGRVTKRDFWGDRYEQCYSCWKRSDQTGPSDDYRVAMNRVLGSDLPEAAKKKGWERYCAVKGVPPSPVPSFDEPYRD